MNALKAYSGRDTFKLAGYLARFVQLNESFTSEQLAGYLRAQGIIGKVVSRVMGNTLRGFASASVISKTDTYRTSERTSKPLIVWRVNK
jgi:hypothetical protein